MRRRKKPASTDSWLEKVANFIKQYQNLSNETIILGAAAVILFFVFSFIIWRTVVADPCDGNKILDSLCEKYLSGKIAGKLCYSICLEQKNIFSYCLKDDGDIKTFLYDNTLIRVNSSLSFHDDPQLTVQEGKTLEELRKEIKIYLQQTIGHSSIDLLLRLIEFSDFNHDETVSLGEAQSLWHLIHIPEFLYYFIFQKSLVFPHLNGTCGNMYAFQYTPHANLYNRADHAWFSKLFTNTYRWNLPPWTLRAKLSVGLLEFAMDIYEEFDNQYLMCDIGPDQFGYTDSYELVVHNVGGVVAVDKVRQYLKNLTCSSDSYCMYSKQCFSQCDVVSGQCGQQVVRPGLWFVCDMLQEYILFDAPRYLYFDLKRLLNKCADLDARQNDIDMQHALLQEDLKSVLWNEIVNNPLT